MRTRVGAVSSGRRRSPRPGSVAMSSLCLSHAWAREVKKMERMGGGVFMF